MLKLLAGFLLGVTVSTVGFSGIVGFLDNGVREMKETVESTVQKFPNQK